MYNNIGGKIKILAFIICGIGILASIISGIIVTEYDEGTGLIILFGGSVISWASSFVLYGFGKLIEDTEFIADQYRDASERKREKEVAKQRKEFNETVMRQKPAVNTGTVNTGTVNTAAQNATTQNTVNVNARPDDNEYFDFPCPLCGETLSYTKGEIRLNETLPCPECNRRFYVRDIFG